jgi:hypothetical protein
MLWVELPHAAVARASDKKTADRVALAYLRDI